jgi:hypothetical protein
MPMKAILFFLLFFTFDSYAIDLKSLLAKVDDLYRSEASVAKMEMEVVTPHWERTMAMDAWSKGTDKTFIRVLSPKKDAGVGTLKLKNEMWNYFPKINKIVKVPSSMMMASWMGSDFTNDDLVREYRYSRDYKASYEDKDSFYLITLIPNDHVVTVWGKIQVEMDKKTELPTKAFYFDEKDKKIRKMEFKERKIIDGRSIPMVMELVPLNKEGHKTVIRYKSLSFKEKVKDSIFSRRNLQKRK